MHPIPENKRKIKLLLVSSVFGDRGAEKLILYLYRFLPRDKYDIKIMCLRKLAPYADYLNENSDVKIDIIGMRHNLDFMSLYKFYSYIKACNPDIINFHHYRAALWGRPLAKLAGISVILYSVHNKWGGTVHHLLDRLLSPLTNAIVPFSYAVRNYMLNEEKIKEKYIEKPIYAGIDINSFSYRKENELELLREELDIKVGQRIIGFVGNVNQEKGLLYLIESIRMLTPSFPDLCCLIIGEGPDEGILKSKITEYDLWHHFKFLGQRQDIHNLLQIMTIFVLPSLREGLPVVLVEALSSSCPVIATDIDGIPEIITNNINGLLIPPGNSIELASAIEKLLSSDNLRNSFTVEGYKTATENFSISKMVEDYDRLYQTYLDKQP